MEAFDHLPPGLPPSRHPASLVVQRSRLLPPKTPRQWLSRSRLLHALDPIGRDQILVLRAPAGAGKSTLVADWLTTRHRSAAWLTVSPHDTDISVLLTHLIAALQHIAPGFGAHTQALIAGIDAPDPMTVRQSFIDETYDLPAGTHIVLDGVHHIDSGPASQIVTYLLRYPPLHTRWVLLSRDVLPAPALLLKSRAALREISFQELRFSPDETERFLASGCHAVTTTQGADRIHAYTDGWPAPIATIARHLPARATAAEVEAYLDGETLKDSGAFLVSEVFDRLPAATRDLALATAVIEKFDADLARALMSSFAPAVDSGLALAAIEREAAIVAPIPHEPGLLRWRPIARDVARDLLVQQCGPEVVRRLHVVAARRLARRDNALLALSHAILAADEDVTAAIAADAGFATLARERWGTLAALIDLVPPPLVDRRADLLVLRAWVSWSMGFIGAMATDVGRARDLLDRSPDTATDVELTRGYLAALEAAVAATEPRLDAAVSAADAAFTHLPGGENVGRGVALQSLVMASALAGQPAIAASARSADLLHREMFSSSLGARAQIALASLAYITRFDLDGMREHLLEGAHQAKRFDLPGADSLAQAWLAAIALLRFDLDEANRRLEACQLDPDGTTLTTWREVQCMNALLHTLRGDHAAAGAIVSDALTRLAGSAGPDRTLPMRALEARLALIRGEDDRALHWALSAPAGQLYEPLTTIGAAALTAVRALASSPAPAIRARALERATRAVAMATAIHHRPLLAHSLATRAAVRALLGDVDGATADLALPLTDLARNQAPLRMLELGSPLAVALRSIAPTDEHYGYAQTLAGQILTDPRDRVAWTADPIVRQLTLSPREVSVLIHLAAPMGNKDIAGALHISPATVKIHVARVLEKLGVTNRAEAARRADALGLTFDKPS